jgi:hypothetical protein
VVGLVERVAVDDLDGVADDLLVEHHRRQQTPLGLDGGGGHAVELAGDRRVDELAHPEILPESRKLANGYRT